MQSETWRKEKMYGEKDTVLWAILTGKGVENIRVIGSALREEDADAIIEDHTAASTLRTELEAYKKAWELPEQPVTQGVVPSAGEVAANAVEEARIYRDQRDALRTALTEARDLLSLLWFDSCYQCSEQVCDNPVHIKVAAALHNTNGSRDSGGDTHLRYRRGAGRIIRP